MTVTDFKVWNNTVNNTIEIAFFHDDTYTKFVVQKDMFVKALKDACVEVE